MSKITRYVDGRPVFDVGAAAMWLEANNLYVPGNALRGIKNWIERGECGHFIGAVVRNDLFGALARGDEANIEALRDITVLIYNEAPSSCFGNPEKAKAWAEARSAERKSNAVDAPQPTKAPPR